MRSAAVMIQVHPVTAYYFPGYERGDWPELVAVMEFLRRRVPEARVWYGDDSSYSVSEVTEAWLSELWDYWALHGGRPYRGKVEN